MPKSFRFFTAALFCAVTGVGLSALAQVEKSLPTEGSLALAKAEIAVLATPDKATEKTTEKAFEKIAEKALERIAEKAVEQVESPLAIKTESLTPARFIEIPLSDDKKTENKKSDPTLKVENAKNGDQKLDPVEERPTPVKQKEAGLELFFMTQQDPSKMSGQPFLGSADDRKVLPESVYNWVLNNLGATKTCLQWNNNFCSDDFNLVSYEPLPKSNQFVILQHQFSLRQDRMVYYVLSADGELLQMQLSREEKILIKPTSSMVF